MSSKKYRIELTEKQIDVTLIALEEYFRLRLCQEIDFCNDIASIGIDLSPDNPNHRRIFDSYISRRDHLSEIMKTVFKIAYEPYGYINKKTDEMMIAECIWDSLRVAAGKSRWSQPFKIGPEPIPTVEIIEE